jgi:hypothetical protein
MPGDYSAKNSLLKDRNISVLITATSVIAVYLLKGENFIAVT